MTWWDVVLIVLATNGSIYAAGMVLGIVKLLVIDPALRARRARIREEREQAWKEATR